MVRGRKKKEDSLNYSFTIKLSKLQKDLLDSNIELKKDIVINVRKYLDTFLTSSLK